MIEQSNEPQFIVEVTCPKTKKVIDQRNFTQLQEAERYMYAEQMQGLSCHIYRREMLTEGV